MRVKPPLYYRGSPLENPSVISRVLGKHLLGQTPLVFTEVYHLLVLLIIDKPSYKIDITVVASVFTELFHVVWQVRITVELRFGKHLICGPCVGKSGMSAFQFRIAIKRYAASSVRCSFCGILSAHL